ncbi:hypothetical protein E4T56_gene10122 [Termitomyces sp. T112]|nr:hypothetical protein E4T56_gene10122 [Termitomyces sp. T112]
MYQATHFTVSLGLTIGLLVLADKRSTLNVVLFKDWCLTSNLRPHGTTAIVRDFSPYTIDSCGFPKSSP